MTIKSTLIALLILSAFKMDAQEPVVTESEMAMSLGTRPGFSIKVTNVEMKSAEKLWYDFVKDEFGSRPKSVKGADELMATEAKLKSISQEQFNLHSTMKVSGNDVILNVWFDLGSSFLNRTASPSGAETAKAKLIDFHYFVQKENAVKQLEQEEDKLKDAEKALSRLVDDGESINKDIRDYEDRIEKSKREKEKNQSEQDLAKSALEAQKLKVVDSKKAIEVIRK